MGAAHATNRRTLLGTWTVFHDLRLTPYLYVAPLFPAVAVLWIVKV
jgi:hypothetical protein